MVCDERLGCGSTSNHVEDRCLDLHQKVEGRGGEGEGRGRRRRGGKRRRRGRGGEGYNTSQSDSVSGRSSPTLSAY